MKPITRHGDLIEQAIGAEQYRAFDHSYPMDFAREYNAQTKDAGGNCGRDLHGWIYDYHAPLMGRPLYALETVGRILATIGPELYGEPRTRARYALLARLNRHADRMIKTLIALSHTPDVDTPASDLMIADYLRDDDAPPTTKTPQPDPQPDPQPSPEIRDAEVIDDDQDDAPRPEPGPPHDHATATGMYDRGDF